MGIAIKTRSEHQRLGENSRRQSICCCAVTGLDRDCRIYGEQVLRLLKLIRNRRQNAGTRCLQIHVKAHAIPVSADGSQKLDILKLPLNGVGLY